MATESPLRMVERCKGEKWHSSVDTATCGSPLRNTAAEELGFLSQMHRIQIDIAETIPNRSGSAPPSMEGSIYAIGNLLSQQNSTVKTSSTNLRPPTLTLLDDSGNKSFHVSQGSLSNQKEELVEASSSRQASDDSAENSGSAVAVKNTHSLASHNKSVLDRIEEDFPRTPSPVYNQSVSSSIATDEPVGSDLHSASPNASSPNTPLLQALSSGSTRSSLTFSSPRALHHNETGNLQEDESNIEDTGTYPTWSRNRSSNIDTSSDKQQEKKIYGQHGPVVIPPFPDPLTMQYYSRPPDDSYSPSSQYGLASPRGIGGQFYQQQSNITSYAGDQKFLAPANGSLGIQIPKKMGGNGSGYYGGLSSMSGVTFPASPHGNPIPPSSPASRMYQHGRQNESRFPERPSRDVGLYPGWQGQRSFNNFEDSRRHSILEELKSNNSRKFEFPDIAGHIAEFSVDQHGSRFIQQKLEYCSGKDKASVFKEVLPHASRLMTDVFGNYVIQKFFEYGTPEQKKELANQLRGHMLPFSLQMYGCRVIQKALELIEVDRKSELVHELDGQVLKCVRDQNGNHVIQKCIECIPTDKIEFIISSFRGQVATLSTHPYGCRVIQRVLEHCSEDLLGQHVVDEILESTCVLAQNQYGNYVTQHVLARGKAYERSQIISKLVGKIVQLSQHKYASNVIEKCLEHGDVAERELMIDEIIGQLEKNDNVLPVMKDQFANYVIQKVLETCNYKQRKILLSLIRVHIDALEKYTYGRHIVLRYE